jgi:hypothetical protein
MLFWATVRETSTSHIYNRPRNPISRIGFWISRVLCQQNFTEKSAPINNRIFFSCGLRYFGFCRPDDDTTSTVALVRTQMTFLEILHAIQSIDGRVTSSNFHRLFTISLKLSRFARAQCTDVCTAYEIVRNDFCVV